jgi:hypothetical protein
MDPPSDALSCLENGDRMASLLQQTCRRQPRQTRADDQNALLRLGKDRLAAKTHSRHRTYACK